MPRVRIIGAPCDSRGGASQRFGKGGAFGTRGRGIGGGGRGRLVTKCPSSSVADSIAPVNAASTESVLRTRGGKKAKALRIAVLGAVVIVFAAFGFAFETKKLFQQDEYRVRLTYFFTRGGCSDNDNCRELIETLLSIESADCPDPDVAAAMPILQVVAMGMLADLEDDDREKEGLWKRAEAMCREIGGMDCSRDRLRELMRTVVGYDRAERRAN